MKGKATKRAIAMATKLASNDKGNGNDSNEGGRQATATRAMVVAKTAVGKDESNGNSDEGESSMAMATV